MIEPLLVVLCGGLDRVRGDKFDFVWRSIDKCLYGWVVAALFGYPFHVLTPFIIAAMFAGCSPGWGNAIGPALNGKKPDPHKGEWWQYGPLMKDAWASLVVRGAMWGVPFLPLAYWDMRLALMVPIVALAMPAAVYIARRMKVESEWEWQEYYRGWLIGLMIWGVV